jgi:DNA-binding CsgD family transcriptional regulator/tetratricopeptide (TPR) repeat protein
VRAQEIVGRDAELSLLERRLKDQLPYTVLLSGDAGIGKSALARTFQTRAAAAGTQVFVGECTSVEVGRPFGPLADVLLRAQREPRTRAVMQRALADPDLRLSALMRGEAQQGREATDPSESFRAHAALFAVLADLSRIRPLVVVLEDVHWADSATLEFLPYAVRKLESEHLLLVVTYRSDELHRLHPLVPVLAELRRLKLVEEVRLAPLGRVETAEMIRSGLGLKEPPDVQLLDAVFERCEGNPYFTQEVVRTLGQTKDLAAVPASIRDTIWVRLATLDERTRSIIQLAAVIGARFDFELLQRVSGAPDDVLIAAIRATIDAHIVVEALDPTGRSCYVFRHALTHEVVLGELLEPERRSLHRSVGLALEQMHSDSPDDVAADLAHHFDAATDGIRAVRYHELAARHAMGIFAFKSAARHLERAVALAADDIEVLGRLELGLARAADLAGDSALAIRVCEHALTHTVDQRQRGEIYIVLSDARWWTADLAGVGAAITDAIAVLTPLGPSPELALAYAIAAARTSLRGNAATSLEFGEQAVALARRLDVPVALVIGLVWVGMSRAEAGRRDGIALIREGIEIGLRHELVEPTISAFGNLGMALLILGAPPGERRQVHAESAAVGRRFAHFRDRFLCHDTEWLIADGNWDAAIRQSVEIRDPMWRASAMLQVAMIHALRDGPGRALGEAAPFRERLVRAGLPQWRARAASFSATALLMGDARLALSFAEELGPTADSSGAVIWTALTHIAAIAAAHELRDSNAKSAWIERALADPPPNNARMTRAARAFARAASQVPADEVLDQLDESAALLEGEVLPLAELIVRLWRAEVRSRMPGRSNRETAWNDVAAVQAFAERVRATWFLAHLSDWSTEHGLRGPRETVPPVSGVLSTREREIANLVAQGLTNKEIAARLVIADRTAEGHVEHILNKLGFHSRSQIATWSTEQQFAPPSGTVEERKRVPTDR